MLNFYYLKSMAFRKKHKVDELSKWEVPDVLKNGIPFGTTGFDKEGSVVIIIPFKGTDAYGLFHSSCKQDVIKYILKLAEGKFFWFLWIFSFNFYKMSFFCYNTTLFSLSFCFKFDMRQYSIQNL